MHCCFPPLAAARALGLSARLAIVPAFVRISESSQVCVPPHSQQGRNGGDPSFSAYGQQKKMKESGCKMGDVPCRVTVESLLTTEWA